jgi:hypothetical protein
MCVPPIHSRTKPLRSLEYQTRDKSKNSLILRHYAANQAWPQSYYLCVGLLFSKRKLPLKFTQLPLRWNQSFSFFLQTKRLLAQITSHCLHHFQCDLTAIWQPAGTVWAHMYCFCCGRHNCACWHVTFSWHWLLSSGNVRLYSLVGDYHLLKECAASIYRGLWKWR